MIILGIDPSLNKCGWALIKIESNKPIYLDSNVIINSAQKNTTDKLSRLHDEITKVIHKYNPNEVAIEENFVNLQVGKINPKSALMLGQAIGALILTCSLGNLDVVSYKPTQIKKSIVGNGRATKEQVLYMVKVSVKKANFNVKTNDESDALSIALCHFYSRKDNNNTNDLKEINRTDDSHNSNQNTSAQMYNQYSKTTRKKNKKADLLEQYLKKGVKLSKSN